MLPGSILMGESSEDNTMTSSSGEVTGGGKTFAVADTFTRLGGELDIFDGK